MKTASLLALALWSSSAAAQTQSDKLLHAGASAVVVDVVWAGCAALDQPLWVRVTAGVAAGAVAGLGKEGLDLAGFGTPDVGDLVFDAFGIGLGVAVGLLVETLVAQRQGDTVRSEQTIVDPRVDPALP